MGLPVNAGDLGALQRQVVHQAFLIKDEPDDRARDAVGVDCAASPDGDDGDRTVDAHLPAGCRLKLRECLLGHEHYDYRARLRPKLKTDRARKDVVIPGCLAADMQRPFPVFAADAETSLHHGREHEYRHRLIGKPTRQAHLAEELTDRCTYLRLDLGPRCGLARRGRPRSRKHHNKKGKTASPYSRSDTHFIPSGLSEVSSRTPTRSDPGRIEPPQGSKSDVWRTAMDLRHSQNSRSRPGSVLSRRQLTTLALSFVYWPPSGIAVPRHSMH